MAAADSDDTTAAIAEQRREIQAARSVERDFDAAFRLQMQEAMAASIAHHPSSSRSHPPPPPSSPGTLTSPIIGEDDNGDFSSLLILQEDEITRFEQQRLDREYVEAAMRFNADDLNRRVHDQKLAFEIHRVPEVEWARTGDYIERPYGDGGSGSGSSSSSSSAVVIDECFRLYFKGLVSEERMGGGSAVSIAGIGVAICDPSDNLLFEQRKPLMDDHVSREVAEFEALIEGLRAALALGLKRVTFFCDDNLTYLYVTKRWQPGEGKIAALVHQVNDLQKRFEYCNSSLLERNRIKFANEFAKDAMVSQITRAGNANRGKIVIEKCAICFENIDTREMFSVDQCQHQYCISCLRQHVVVKLHQARVPDCPHPGCQSNLHIDRCKKFLSTELVELMSLRIKEASIPATEKVYCPNPKCSALMSASEALEHSKRFFNTENSGSRKCIKCQGVFCVNCKVPWHANMTCHIYRTANPHLFAEDVKLKSLATQRRWRQCLKCNHMIELLSGCNHIYCRCGYEFCYICGAEWRKKVATCSCPLWDERNLLYEENKRQRQGR